MCMKRNFIFWSNFKKISVALAVIAIASVFLVPSNQAYLFGSRLTGFAFFIISRYAGTNCDKLAEIENIQNHTPQKNTLPSIIAMATWVIFSFLPR